MTVPRMELRQYWEIAARRWQLIVVVTGLTFVASALMLAFGPTYYKGELRLVVSVEPEPTQGSNYLYDPRYYSWLTSEYLVDDLGEVIRSEAFAREVSARLNQSVPPDAIRRDLSTKKTHRILAVTITTSDPKQSLDIATALKDVIEAKADNYFLQLSTGDAMVEIIDGPRVDREMGRMRLALELGLRTAVGLLAAVALAFLLHYLDPSVRDAAEAERLLGLPVLAEVPR